MENNNFVFNNGYPQNNNQYFEQLQEKKNDKKILRTIGILCGFSIVIYFLASTLAYTIGSSTFSNAEVRDKRLNP